MEREPQGRQYAEKGHVKVSGILEILNYLLNTPKKLLGSHHTRAAGRTSDDYIACVTSHWLDFFSRYVILKSDGLNQNASYDGNGNLRLEHSLKSVMPI